MSSTTYAVPPSIQNGAHCNSMQQYRDMHKESMDDPSTFWGKIASEFYWKTPPTKENFLNYNFDTTKGPIHIKWMKGATTNVCYNMLDRNIENGLGDNIAFYWEGNDPDDSSSITYKELQREVCKFSNVLKHQGVQKGDRVAIYMPMIKEIVISMLACSRIGAVHSVVFAGFSATSLAERMLDGQCCIIVTSDGVWRGSKLLDLKKIADGALHICQDHGHIVRKCIVVRHLNPSDETTVIDDAIGDPDATPEPLEHIAKRPYKIEVHMKPERDAWWHEEMKSVSDECEPEWCDAEDPLFMLYTSGSTGKPKGVLHTCGGYMLYTATTFKYVFDYHQGDVFWCTADVGWITGHSYVCYGPLGVGATGVIFEGTPFYPGPDRFWAVVQKYKISKFYTAPTAIRSLMKYGNENVLKYNLESLVVLGTVGEPINPEAWLWYHKVVGNEKCAIVDTFWQTETGGHVITPLPGVTPTKPGSATFPFFGVEPAILSDDGTVIEGEGEGYLVFRKPWPGIMRTVYGNQERFETTYFKKFSGFYCTGDGARRDADGYIWITGRIDDMLNVSGHLLSTAEVESALIEHPSIAETAAVSHPHPVKGECLFCFITVKEGNHYTPELEKELKSIVRHKIGPFAQPDYMQEAPGLPKTRSGKIMRRVLRKIAVNERDIGDVSTIADESVLQILYDLRAKLGN